MSKNVWTNYYQENKERLPKARERYKNLSIEEKEKKAEYGLEKFLKRWKTKSCLV